MMNYLLDTHAVIWFITNDNQLPEKTKKLISDSTSDSFYVSTATLWELAIKFSLDRIELGFALEEVFKVIDDSGFTLLPISSLHILKVSGLSFHHRDPFDRILIAQAIVEDLSIITRDKAFLNYECNIIWN